VVLIKLADEGLNDVLFGLVFAMGGEEGFVAVVEAVAEEE